MKKYSRLFTYFLLVVIVGAGCEEDDTANVSFVTSYPIIEVLGGDAIAIVSGSTFADPGVSATENGENIDVTVSGSVDTNTPGFYRLTYSAVNSDGYSASASRLVAVTAEDVTNTDLTGTYYRESNNRQSVVTRISGGLYFITDCWGTASSGGAPLPVNSYLLHTGGTNLILRYDEPGAPFGGNTGTGTILPDRLSLDVLLISANAQRVNEWIRL